MANKCDVLRLIHQLIALRRFNLHQRFSEIQLSILYIYHYRIKVIQRFIYGRSIGFAVTLHITADREEVV